MELGVAITLVIGLGFLSIIGFKIFKNYSSSELKKAEMANQVKENETILLLRKKIDDTQNVLAQTKYKLKKARNAYDLDFEDEELEDLPQNADDEFNLSDIAKVVYPKLPPALGNLIDKEEFQNAIAKTVEKKPDLITNFIDKYLNKPANSSDQGSTNKLQETYL